MARRTTKPKTKKTLEQTLWEAADKLRGNQEPSEYKHVVLGLVFLKYISDRFDERRKALKEDLVADGIKPERIPSFIDDRDEYVSHNVFWVPEFARWQHIQSMAKQPEIGQTIDQAMDLIERENASLRGVLPRNYGREGLDKQRLGELVDLIGRIGFETADDHGADDVLGRVYEYFLGQFAGKETGSWSFLHAEIGGKDACRDARTFSWQRVQSSLVRLDTRCQLVRTGCLSGSDDVWVQGVLRQWARLIYKELIDLSRLHLSPPNQGQFGVAFIRVKSTVWFSLCSSKNAVGRTQSGHFFGGLGQTSVSVAPCWFAE